jgi:pyruvate dehydrogenase E2 component (dihydrolipoamide acetyltransferase)
VESFESGYLASIIVEEGGSAGVGSTVALIAENQEDIPKVRECGLDCIVSGSGNRHDGTTAVHNTAAAEQTADAPEAAAPSSEPKADGTAITKPDLIEIWMPALSSTMELGKIDAYYVEVGSKIKAGDIIMAVESDKASMDVEAFDSGILAHIAVEVGGEAKVGDPVAFLAKSEEDVGPIQAWAMSQKAVPVSSNSVPSEVVNEAVAPSPSKQAPPVPSSSLNPVVNTGRIIASPWAKKLARELGVDLSRVRGTGPNGRIIGEDVELAASASASTAPTSDLGAPTGVAVQIGIPAPAGRTDGKIVATPDAKKVAKLEKIDLANVVGTGNYGRITAEDVLKAAGKAPEPKQIVSPSSSSSQVVVEGQKSVGSVPAAMPEGAVAMTGMQKAVVQNMTASLAVPVFRVSYAIKTTEFDILYAKLKPKGVTVSALLAKAVAITLLKHPILNAAYGKDTIVYRPDINIAMAVAMPDGGLMTPTLKNADKVDLYTLSRSWKDLVKRTVEKSIKPDEYNSGTFFISNLGMYGVSSFDAILPPGAPAILAVAASKPVVALQPSGLIGAHKEMIVNITCDHRHIYGAQAADFLRDLANLLENDVMQLVL